LLTRTNTVLLEGLKNPGDRVSWETFDARYRPIILAVAKRLGLQEADAEDAAQETMAAFVERYRQQGYDRGKGRLRDWLRGIARHKVQDILRRNSRREVPVGDKTDATGFLNQVEDEQVQTVWEDEWEKAVLRQCLEEVKQEVSPRTFEAFELFALRDWPAKRVASHLQVSEDTVYQGKSRILARIRELLPEMEKVW
jgi:RNA polymerase sigma-70 factor (ECF subfamily)